MNQYLRFLIHTALGIHVASSIRKTNVPSLTSSHNGILNPHKFTAVSISQWNMTSLLTYGNGTSEQQAQLMCSAQCRGHEEVHARKCIDLKCKNCVVVQKNKEIMLIVYFCWFSWPGPSDISQTLCHVETARDCLVCQPRCNGSFHRHQKTSPATTKPIDEIKGFESKRTLQVPLDFVGTIAMPVTTWALLTSICMTV